MLDHISFSVNDYIHSIKFYDETLKILGIERLMTFETKEHNVAGYGIDGKPYFWIASDATTDNQEFIGKSKGFHVAFQAPDIEAIKSWHQKCLELGVIKIMAHQLLVLNITLAITVPLLLTRMGGE